MPTEMTFSVSRDQGQFEWAGSSLGTLFCQRGNLFSLSMWRMIIDIVRFNHFAADVLTADSSAQETIGEYLDRERYSHAFRDNYLIPMTAAVWSTGPDKCALDFPAATLIRFLSVVCPPENSIRDTDVLPDGTTICCRLSHHGLHGSSSQPGPRRTSIRS